MTEWLFHVWEPKANKKAWIHVWKERFGSMDRLIEPQFCQRSDIARLGATYRNVKGQCTRNRNSPGQKANPRLQPWDKVSGLICWAGRHPASKEPPNTYVMWGRWLEETGRVPIPVLYREPCILVTPGLDTEGIVTTVESNYFHNIPYFCLYSIRHWLETQLQHLLALQSWWNYLTFISLNFFICKMPISAT